MSFAACPKEAISSLYLTLSLNINEAPRIGAMEVPSELNACDKLSLLEAPSLEPNTDTYGLAATCKMVIHPASIKYAKRKIENVLYEAAG